MWLTLQPSLINIDKFINKWYKNYMEKEPGRQHPEVREVAKEELEALFDGYGFLADECGERGDGGEDAAELLDSAGNQISPISLTVEADTLPQNLRERGITELDIMYEPPIVAENIFENEQLSLAMYEGGTGISKTVGLSRSEHGELRAWSILQAESTPVEDEYLEADLSAEQIEDIYARVEAGERAVLMREGAQGEVARAAYFDRAEDEIYTSVIEPEDVNLLAEALPAIEGAMLDQRQ